MPRWRTTGNPTTVRIGSESPCCHVSWLGEPGHHHSGQTTRHGALVTFTVTDNRRPGESGELDRLGYLDLTHRHLGTDHPGEQQLLHRASSHDTGTVTAFGAPGIGP